MLGSLWLTLRHYTFIIFIFNIPLYSIYIYRRGVEMGRGNEMLYQKGGREGGLWLVIQWGFLVVNRKEEERVCASGKLI